MISPYGFLAYALLQTVTICVLFVALCDIARRAFGLDELCRHAPPRSCLGLLGYLSFWLAYANYAVFGVAKIAVLAGLLIRFGLLVYRRRIGAYRWLAEPLLYSHAVLHRGPCARLLRRRIEPYRAQRQPPLHPPASGRQSDVMVGGRRAAVRRKSNVAARRLAVERSPSAADRALSAARPAQPFGGLSGCRVHGCRRRSCSASGGSRSARCCPRLTRRVVLLACCLLPSRDHQHVLRLAEAACRSPTCCSCSRCCSAASPNQTPSARRPAF